MDTLPNATLPDDIIAIILSYLPLLSLLRFKSVCKSWRTIINSVDFINKHMEQSESTNSNRQLVMADSNHIDFCTYDLDSPEIPSARLRLPEALRGRKLELGGSCKGVMCFYFRDNNESAVIVSLNPSTQQYKLIPIDGNFTTYIGLGYDHVNCDFKIVRVYCDEVEGNFGMSTAVYSLRGDSWKFVEGYGNFFWECSGVTIDSHLIHWIPASSKSCMSISTLITCYDVCEEKWSTIKSPYYDYYQRKENGTPDHRGDDSSRPSGDCCSTDHYLKLGELGGCLCMFSAKGDEVNVWVMKDYGVVESWVKLLDISNSGITLRMENPPLAFSKNRREILVFDDYSLGNVPIFYWYDLHEKRITRLVAVDGLSTFDGAVMCWKTLARLDGGVQ